jgi:pimeloyl-ACP methyl ester carboxylesterase
MRMLIKLETLLLVVALFQISVGTAIGQNVASVVATMETGVQHEGEPFDIPTYQVGKSVFQPYAGNPIAVIDDGLRRVFVNKKRIVGNLGPSARRETIIEIPQKTFNGSEGGGTLLYTGPFNEYGHREFTVREGGVVRTFVQGITKISPRWCELQTLVGTDGTPRQWEMRISTSTVPKQVLRNLLLSRISDENPNDYYDLVDFFQQKGDFDQANRELAIIEQRFPDQKDRIANLRTQLEQLSGRQILEEMKTRIDNGQDKLSLGLAEAMNARMASLSLDIRAEFQAIKDRYNERLAGLQAAREQVFALIESVQNLQPEQLDTVKQFKTELETELNFENVARLDSFLTLAEDQATPASNKVSLAISGWLLGTNAAIPNLAITSELFQVRKLIREYLQDETTAARRQQIIQQLEEFESGTPETVNAILKQMKPIQPMDLSGYNGKEPLEFFVTLDGTESSPGPWRYRCQVHLPPEYNPYRKYPLLITLPGPLRPLAECMNIWAGSHNASLSEKLGLAVRNGHAMRNGYIVVAVDWRNTGQRDYRYSAPEHRVVLDALRESLRKFSIDSDRVFLAGHGLAADAAYDIAISHPEHFAGVVGFSGKFDRYVIKYDDSWRKAGDEYFGLPIYCVVGEKDFGSKRPMESLLDQWLRSKRYNALTLVEYRGRPNELFLEEIPQAFKWMAGQNRRWPDERGFEYESYTIRQTDCYFWFFEMHGIPEKHAVPPILFTQTTDFDRLMIGAKTKGKNRFDLDPSSTTSIKNDATLWLSPEFFDFSQNLEIKGRGSFKGPVKPSTKVLLNDVLRRADPEHAYWAGVDMIDGAWIVKE